jgi:hypothetical protein
MTGKGVDMSNGQGGRMNTPTLSAAIAQQRWDVAAHLLVYGLIRVHTNGNGARPVECVSVTAPRAAGTGTSATECGGQAKGV